jgi:hypothetical protein
VDNADAQLAPGVLKAFAGAAPHTARRFSVCGRTDLVLGLSTHELVYTCGCATSEAADAAHRDWLRGPCDSL